MTIIEPNKNVLRINFVVPALILALIFGILLNIYLYNSIVSLRHVINESLTALENLEVSNADLKNDLYKTLEAKNLISLVGSFGLVKENKPDYLENPWVVASHY